MAVLGQGPYLGSAATNRRICGDGIMKSLLGIPGFGFSNLCSGHLSLAKVNTTDQEHAT